MGGGLLLGVDFADDDYGLVLVAPNIIYWQGSPRRRTPDVLLLRLLHLLLRQQASFAMVVGLGALLSYRMILKMLRI